MNLHYLLTQRSTVSKWRLWSVAAMLILGGTYTAQAQVGNVCGTPIVVTALPFDDAGNTANYGDDYEASDVPAVAVGAITTGTGSTSYISGDEVVYAYTPSGDQVISVSSTTTGTWVGLWAFTGCPFASTVGYHTGTDGAPRAINNLPVQGGTTYYFVLGTWPSPQSTGFTIHIELISAAEPCTATTDPGATTGPLNSCDGVSFTLGLENTASEGGISYQWEVSTDGSTWAAAPGSSTGPSYSTVQSEPRWYRCQVSCDGFSTLTSTPLQVGVSTAEECYCTPVGAQNNGDEILNFTLSDLNNSSAPSEGLNGYSDYTASIAPAQLIIANSYVASLTSGTGFGAHGAAIWIDLNDNGLFEITEMVTSLGASVGPNVPVDFPAFIVPNAPGVHRLRVQYTHNQPGFALDPCVITTQFAETEDYLVELSMSVGITENGIAHALSVYPNPATTELFISTDAKPAQLMVHDMLGQVVVQGAMSSQLNIAHLAPGSYSLLLRDAQGNIQARRRFIKQ